MQDEVVGLIGEQRAALLTFLAGAGPADWDKPTVCAPWTVKDVLAHMVEGELNVGKVYRGEMRETGYIDPQIGIDKWSPLPGEAVRAALWQHGTATQRVLDAMTEDIWRAPIKAFGCREIRQLVRLQLFDGAVHGHDLTDALGGEPLWGPALAFLAEFVVRSAPPTFARRGLEPSGRLLVAAEDARWLLDGTNGAWRVDHDVAGSAGAPSIELDRESLVLLATGRGDQDEIVARATVTGDAAEVERILKAWRVV